MKLRSFCIANETITWKGRSESWREYLPDTHLIEDSYIEYAKNSKVKNLGRKLSNEKLEYRSKWRDKKKE